MKNKRNNEYWQNRFEQLEKASHQEALTTYNQVEQEYIKAQQEIERKINNWYVRVAQNNQISMTDAKKLLNSAELKEFKWDVQEYIKYGHENQMNESWMKELENASARYHISRLEALKMQTQQSMEVAFGNQLDNVDNLIKNTYTNGYYHTAFEIEKGFNVGYKMEGIDHDKLEKIISKPWAVDEKNFSERIWDNKNTLINELHQQLTRMCLTGGTPDKTITYMAKKFNTSKARAGNLIMTESAYFSSLSQKDCFNDLNVEKYEIVATLDTRTSEICREQDGKVYEMKDYQPGITAPPFHNYCRSTTVPHFDDDYGLEGERAARDENGKTYYVSDKMKYNDWYNKYVTNTPETKIKPENIQNKKSLTQKQKEAIEYYVSGNAMYLNNALRNRSGMTIQDLTDSDKEIIKELDSALDNTIEQQTLYRSVDASAIFDNISQTDYENLKDELAYKTYSNEKGQYAESITNKCNNLIEKAKNKTIVDKGYVSTTIDEKIANEWNDYTGSDKPIVLKITTENNVKGLDVSNLTDKLKEIEQQNPQKEILLARNQTYKVGNIYSKNGNIYVDVKVSNKEVDLNNVVKNDTIKVVNSNWTDFKTMDDAKEYVYNKYIDSDIDKIRNVESINATFKQLDKLKNQYPLNSEIFIRNKTMPTDTLASGSYKGIHINTAKFNKANMTALSGKNWAKYCDEEIEKLKKYLGNKQYKQKPIENAIDKLEIQKKYDCFGTANKYSGLESIKATISHEYGHVIADQYFGQINKKYANEKFSYLDSNECYKKCKEVLKAYFKALNNKDIYKISYYASTDDKEFFAECFAKKQMGEKLPDYIDEMIERVLKNGK